MIVLDTNVISALMQSTPDPKVVAWLDQQASESIWITTVNVFEIQFSLESIPKGKRQRALRESFDQLLNEDLAGQVLEFDLPAARHIFGRIVEQVRKDLCQTGGVGV